MVPDSSPRVFENKIPQDLENQRLKKKLFTLKILIFLS